MNHINKPLISGCLTTSENSLSSAGWKRLKFGDVCKVQGGFAFKSQEYQKSGVPLVRISNLVEGRVSFDSDTVYLAASKLDIHKDFILKRGDTLIAMSGATTGKMATYEMDSPALLNQRVGRFRILSAEACNPRFISLLVQQITRQVLKEAYGAAQPNISPTHIEQIPIPFPPLEEQNAIVGEIEKQFTRLDAGIAGLRRVQANLKRYRAAVLKAACEGKLVRTEAELARQEGRMYETGAQLIERIVTGCRQKWNAKYKEPAKPYTANLPPLPEGWIWATLPQLGELNRGKSKHRPRDDASLYGGPYPFIQTGDIHKSRGTIREHSQTYSAIGLQQSRLWPAETLCITIAANIAETGILTYPACFPDSVVGFVFDGDQVTTRYIEFFLRTAKESLDRFAPATAQKNINLNVLQNVAIPLPPVAEQQRIVAEVERRLSVVEELDAVVNANLQRAIRLRQSILQQAFEGNIAVPS